MPWRRGSKRLTRLRKAFPHPLGGQDDLNPRAEASRRQQARWRLPYAILLAPWLIGCQSSSIPGATQAGAMGSDGRISGSDCPVFQRLFDDPAWTPGERGYGHLVPRRGVRVGPGTDIRFSDSADEPIRVSPDQLAELLQQAKAADDARMFPWLTLLVANEDADCVQLARVIQLIEETFPCKRDGCTYGAATDPPPEELSDETS